MAFIDAQSVTKTGRDGKPIIIRWDDGVKEQWVTTILPAGAVYSTTDHVRLIHPNAGSLHLIIPGIRYITHSYLASSTIPTTSVASGKLSWLWYAPGQVGFLTTLGNDGVAGLTEAETANGTTVTDLCAFVLSVFYRDGN